MILTQVKCFHFFFMLNWIDILLIMVLNEPSETSLRNPRRTKDEVNVVETTQIAFGQQSATSAV